MKETKLRVVASPVEEVEAPSEIQVGQWYWIGPQPKKEAASEDDDEDFEDDEDDDEDFEDDGFEEAKKEASWLGCLIHIGSNYFKLDGVHHQVRIHADNFYARCTREHNAEAILKKEVVARQMRVRELMAQVQEITERLALSPEEQLPDASQHTQALATTVLDPKEHKAALVKAKDQDLPRLFSQIENENRELAHWMTAPTIPLKARANGMRKVIKTIDQRIFHVELYAGLTEEVEQIRDGKPAHKREKLKLFQRRHYMDEECLIDYKAGGMEFKSLGGFDRWLTRRKNLDRILPFPRCAVAFQVRRKEKDREFDGSLASFIKIRDKRELDKLTFLYIRNGDQVYRMETAIDFGAKLFPDLEESRLHGNLWVHCSDRSKVIDQNRYDGMGEDYERKMKVHRRKKRAWNKAKKEIKMDAQYREDRKQFRQSYRNKQHADERALEELLKRNGFEEPSRWPPENEQNSYQPFDHTNVYYDDATEKWAEALAKHNRIALILQGLFDRSPVLHPHPKAKLWTGEGFAEAVELIYDEDHALTSGDKPDFEAYWAKCNESLATGSVVVGQEDEWLLHEGEKYRARYWRDKHPPKRYRPYGNPGPGFLAKVSKFRPRVRKCVFEWMRERQQRRGWPHYDRPEIRTTFTVDADKVFNVDAYKPGDFKQFYADPRTRAEYIKWAPFLLTAEDYHAGKGPELGEYTRGY